MDNDCAGVVTGCFYNCRRDDCAPAPCTRIPARVKREGSQNVISLQSKQRLTFVQSTHTTSHGYLSHGHFEDSAYNPPSPETTVAWCSEHAFISKPSLLRGTTRPLSTFYQFWELAPASFVKKHKVETFAPSRRQRPQLSSGSATGCGGSADVAKRVLPVHFLFFICSGSVHHRIESLDIQFWANVYTMETTSYECLSRVQSL